MGGGKIGYSDVCLHVYQISACKINAFLRRYAGYTYVDTQIFAAKLLLFFHIYKFLLKFFNIALLPMR